ncbi:MAG: hypothetical protein H7Z74_14845, partial [Anaerolineae bacterium]|nr:hypothetical protein [Gemmatimonadaceae bacterium]
MTRARSPTNNPLRVLLLEDSASDAELITRELQRSTMQTTIERVDSAQA